MTIKINKKNKKQISFQNIFVLATTSLLLFSFSDFQAAESNIPDRTACNGALSAIARSTLHRGRHKEVERTISLVSSNSHTVFVGSDSLGQKAVYETLQERFFNENNPIYDESRRGSQMVLLEWHDLILNEDAKLDPTNVLQNLRSISHGIDPQTEEGKQKGSTSEAKPIVIIPDLPQLLNPGDAQFKPSAEQARLARTIKHLMDTNQIQVIGLADNTAQVSGNADLNLSTQTVVFEELNEFEIFASLEAQVSALEAEFGVNIDPEALSAARALGERYYANVPSPVRELKILRMAAGHLQRMGHGFPQFMAIRENQINELRASMRFIETNGSKESADYIRMNAQLQKLVAAHDQDLAEYNEQKNYRDIIRDQFKVIRETNDQLAQEKAKGDAADLELIATLEATLERAKRQFNGAKLELADLTKNSKTRFLSTTVDAALIADTLSDLTEQEIEYTSGGRSAVARGMMTYLTERVIGQDEAIEQVWKQLRSRILGAFDSNDRTPRGVFLLVGPTGSGKTYLGDVLETYLNPAHSKEGAITYSMAQYSSDHLLDSLFGTATGYIGFKPGAEGGSLTRSAVARPFSVMRFDEIEKGAPSFGIRMMEGFDRGYILAGDSTMVSIRNNIIMMTSNIGTEFYSDELGEDGRFTQETLNKITEAVRKKFPPELIARIEQSGGVIIFNPLPTEAVERIVLQKLKKLDDMVFVEEMNVDLDISDPALIRFLRDNSYDVSGGVRGLQGFIKEHIVSELEEVIMDDQIQREDKIIFKLNPEFLEIYNQNKELIANHEAALEEYGRAMDAYNEEMRKHQFSNPEDTENLPEAPVKPMAPEMIPNSHPSVLIELTHKEETNGGQEEASGE